MLCKRPIQCLCACEGCNQHYPLSTFPGVTCLLTLVDVHLCCAQAAKAVSTKKAKCLIIAPNIEQIDSEGGLDDILTRILNEAREHQIRIVFALTRSRLGQVGLVTTG